MYGILPNIGVSGDEQNLQEKSIMFAANKVLKVYCGKAIMVVRWDNNSVFTILVLLLANI